MPTHMDEGTRSMLLYLLIFYVIYAICVAGFLYTFQGGPEPESVFFPSQPTFPTFPTFSGSIWDQIVAVGGFLWGILAFVGLGLVFIVQVFALPLTVSFTLFPSPLNWIMGSVMGAILAVLSVGLITWSIPIFEKIAEVLARLAHAIAEAIPL